VKKNKKGKCVITRVFYFFSELESKIEAGVRIVEEKKVNRKQKESSL
jgi:hypothetical protein